MITSRIVPCWAPEAWIGQRARKGTRYEKESPSFSRWLVLESTRKWRENPHRVEGGMTLSNKEGAWRFCFWESLQTWHDSWTTCESVPECSGNFSLWFSNLIQLIFSGKALIGIYYKIKYCKIIDKWQDLNMSGSWQKWVSCQPWQEGESVPELKTRIFQEFLIAFTIDYVD